MYEDGRLTGIERAEAISISWLSGSVYEVVSLLAMVGKRGQLEPEQYQVHRQEANEIAAMLGGLAKATQKNKIERGDRDREQRKK